MISNTNNFDSTARLNFFFSEAEANTLFCSRVSDPDPDPQDPHVFALPGSGSGQKGKEMNE